MRPYESDNDERVRSRAKDAYDGIQHGDVSGVHVTPVIVVLNCPFEKLLR